MPGHTIVAFDFDGTLVDSRDAIVASAQAAFAEFSLTPPTREQMLSYMGIPVEKSFPRIHQDSIPLDENLRLVNRYREIYREVSRGRLALYPGIAELLGALQLEKRRIGVVTSKSAAAAWENAAQLGIDIYLEKIVGAHEVKNPKPDPEPLKVLCALFGASPTAATIVIGDATFDIEMANRGGAQSCAVTWGAHSEAKLREVRPTFVAHTVEELRAVLSPPS